MKKSFFVLIALILLLSAFMAVLFGKSGQKYFDII